MGGRPATLTRLPGSVTCSQSEVHSDDAEVVPGARGRVRWLLGGLLTLSVEGRALQSGRGVQPPADRPPCPRLQVVDSQLVCMMNENSVDYISRFNDLAQELSIAEPSRREALFDGGGGGPPVTDLSQ